METEQICSDNIKKAHHNKPSSKQNQKKKAVAENQSNLNAGDLARNTKLQKPKGVGVVSVPKQGLKGPSAALLTKKNKGKPENNQCVNKEDSNKDETKKQSGKKNKKSADVTQKQYPALCARGAEDTEQRSKNPTKKADTKKGLLVQKSVSKGPLDQKVVSPSNSGQIEGKQKLSNEEISKTGSEISKSKKRRIRKKRLLKSFGFNIVNSVESTKDKCATKKRKKKKKSQYAPDNCIITEESLHKDCTALKSVNKEVVGLITNISKDTNCSIVGKGDAVKNSEDVVNFTKILKDTDPKKSADQVISVKETQSEKTVIADILSEVKEGNITLDSSASVKVSSNCEEDLPFPDSKVHLDDISLPFLSKTEVPSPSGRADLVNFLSHDNVEGLFRSALLNDITLSSRCSEKEVKNFFNTYGTFSERGRTQFAAVEKLLHSNSKGSEDIVTSQYFEPELDKGIYPTLAPQNLTETVKKEPSQDSSTSTLTLVKSPNYDYFLSRHMQDNDDAVESVSVSKKNNQVVKGLNHTDSVGNSLVFKGGLCRGPIYTSPNLENRVTSSANSNQIPNSANRVFVPDAYVSCDLNQEEKFGYYEVSNLQKLDSELVDGLSGKQHILPGDRTQNTEVCSVSEHSTCIVSPRLEDSHKEQALDHAEAAEVNTVECQDEFVCKNDMVTECRGTEGNFITESHPSVNAECSKEGKPVCTRLNKNICCTAQEKVDSEKLPEKIQENSGAEKFRWIGFVTEYSDDNQETGFEANRTVESVISLKEVRGHKPDCVSHISHAEVSYSDNRCNTVNESVFRDFHTDSGSKEQESLPNYSSVSEVLDSEIVKSSTILSQDKVIMDPSRTKPMESSDICRPEKSREEILAARQAKRADKLGRNKISVIPLSSENVPVPKAQTSTGSSKSRQQQKSVTDSAKRVTKCTADGGSVSKKTIQFSDVKEPHSPVKDTSHQTSEVENNLPIKRIEPNKKKDGYSEIENSVPTRNIKGDEADGETEKFRGKVKEISHGPEFLTVLPASKSKAELRAERRAKQEQQRARKAVQQQAEVHPTKSTAIITAVNSKEKQPRKDTGDDLNKKAVKIERLTKVKTSEHKVKLFNHLYHERGPLAITENLMLYGPALHPAIVKLGMQYADRVVVGSNSRCIALLDALKQVIRDYETPPQKEFSRGLETELQPSVAFLDGCRPISVSMTNALRHLTWQLTQLSNNVSDSEAKKKLLEAIDTYIREQIEVAAQAICIMVQRKIANGDVILTYGCSSLLQRILLEAHRNGTKFRVIIVDGRPWREGREMLRRLVECGLHCSYVLVSAASFIMREVTKVFLGAHALLANGYVMSRAGSSQVALLAHSHNVPVLVCCETHKFCERVQTDSFVYNELGNPDDLIPTDASSKECPLSQWRSVGSLTPLNLTYDVTPPDLVTAVVTELAILPCTSVPVILRIKPTEIGC
ncbi:Translation initiation factor eIF-2B subunit delta [Zootermopsis nevadensis]|uniref:Translation initiation factor eIF2B subunit delta n=1 Tax=Zootermopsis nevadensis TaxID=136037 RepID=A0A067RIH4_ZOONE|nr:Translation initiation factor eIF-2B subunit delta [Zootermopsis nevadensis]